MISLCIVPPVPPTLAIQVVNATATDGTRVLAHIGSLVSITCKMTAAYTEGNLQVHWSADTDISNIPQTRLSSTEVHLDIDSATREHEGRYTCHAINYLGSVSMSVNIVVGTTPEPLSINATSSNNTLIVMWKQSTTEDFDQQIIAHYVQYFSTNTSSNVVVVEKFAASVQEVTLRNVERNVEYRVFVKSENAFGNGTDSNIVSVVIAGMYE